MGRSPDKIDLHHCIPSSRGGGKGPNLKPVRHDIHMAWHYLFYNLLPWEVIAKIKAHEYKYSALGLNMKEAWDFLFGKLPQEEVIALICQDWYPPYIYLDGDLLSPLVKRELLINASGKHRARLRQEKPELRHKSFVHVARDLYRAEPFTK